MSLQSIVITGASRGIGLEFVRQLLASDKPPKHLIATIRQSSHEELDKLRAKNSCLHVLQLDTKNSNEFEKFAEKVKQIVANDGVDTLINNAGIPSRDGLNGVTAEQMLEVYTVNTVGPLMLTKAMLPLLRTAVGQRKTAVINISSDLGSIELNKYRPEYAEAMGGYISCVAYRSSKAALNQVSKTLANELEADGIVVVSLNPGWTQTDMGGPKAHLTTPFSVSSQIQAIKSIKKEDSGKAFDYNGSVLPY